MDNPQDNDVTAESADDTPDVENSDLDDDAFLAGIDTDSEINLSLLPDRTSPPPAKPSPPAEPAPSNPQQSSYRGLLLLTILLVLIPVLGGFALWQMNNSKMQAEINRLEATINAQAAGIDTQVATRVAAAVAQAGANAPIEVPVEVVEVVVTATPLPATLTPVPLNTPTVEPTDSLAAELEPPTATPPLATAAVAGQSLLNNTTQSEAINVSNVTEAENPVTVPVGQSIYFQDNFESNTKGWFTGQRTHPHARDVSEIIDGNYHRSVVSAQGDVFKESSPTFTTRNFVISTDATLQESSGQTGIGLTFREDVNGNYYLAKFNANGTAELLLFNNGHWQSIASQPGVELIPGEINNLAVAATGQNFTLYINGRPLLATTDNTLSGAGKVGFAVTTSAPNQMMVADFDNLLVTNAPQEGD